MLRDIDRLARKAEGARVKLFLQGQRLEFPAPALQARIRAPGLTFARFLNTLQGMTDHSQGRGKGDGTFTYKTLLVAGMHFMDVYNYDIKPRQALRHPLHRAHGLVYPFCTYNSGPCFREKIEKQYSVPLPKSAGEGLVNVS